MKKLGIFFLLYLTISSTLALTPEEDLEGYDEDDRFMGINIHDALSRDSGMQNLTVEIITRDGYPWEEYEVITPDSYVLKLFRIPGSPQSPPAFRKQVAFLQHGLLCSSADWVVTGPGQALAYILADAGYDVWLGNARGNTHSRRHLYLNPDKKAFWDFSWHEIGQIDLPAMIDFVLAKTQMSKLHYIGHSQGTTSFFVMGSLRKDYMDKIITMQALAPVAFMSNLKSPFVRAMSPFVNSIDWVTKMLGIHEFFPSNKMMKKGGYFLCRDEAIFQEVCANVLFLICGFNSQQLNRTMLPEILQYTPAGASVNQLVHYGQEVNSGKFRMYDHGFFGNRARYGSSSPPNYDLKNVVAPVALHFSDNDWLAAVKDVDQLGANLPNLIGKFRVGDPKWNHLDFTWGIDVKTLLYERVISLMRRYE